MAEALASGAGGYGLPLEPVLDVLPARWASDLCQLACHDLRDECKSPIHSSRRLVPGSRLVEREF